VNWTLLFTNTCGDGNPFYFCDPCWTNLGGGFTGAGCSETREKAEKLKS